MSPKPVNSVLSWHFALRIASNIKGDRRAVKQRSAEAEHDESPLSIDALISIYQSRYNLLYKLFQLTII